MMRYTNPRLLTYLLTGGGDW